MTHQGPVTTHPAKYTNIIPKQSNETLTCLQLLKCTCSPLVNLLSLYTSQRLGEMSVHPAGLTSTQEWYFGRRIGFKPGGKWHICSAAALQGPSAEERSHSLVSANLGATLTLGYSVTAHRWDSVESEYPNGMHVLQRSPTLNLLARPMACVNQWLRNVPVTL